MKHCFAKRQTTLKSVLLIMLLMFTSLAVNAQSAESTGKYKPYVYISKTGYGITANGEPATYLQDMAFIEPSVLVYEGEDNKALISNRFYISYYLTSGSENGTKGTEVVEKGKTFSVDPVVRLTRIFRQAQTSRIIMNAHAINAGRMPDIRNGKQSDFFFMECEEPEQIASTIVDLVSHRLPKAYNLPRSSIQVLTPMQRSVIGANNLNISIQQRVNPTGNGLTRAGFTFRKGDRVLQLKNDYTKEVFNGDIGLVTAVNMEDRTLTVSFDGKEVEYESTELDELSLAYATTIHKSQGSEYPIVVIPVHFTNYIMLQRNLIYTAVTRAKKVCIVIGQRRALWYAVSHVTVTERNTRLKERLQGKTIPLSYTRQDEESQMDMAAEDGPTTK